MENLKEKELVEITDEAAEAEVEEERNGTTIVIKRC